MGGERPSGKEKDTEVKEEFREVCRKVEVADGVKDIRWERIYQERIRPNIAEVDRWSFDAFDGRVAEWIVADLVDQALPQDAERDPLLDKLRSDPGEKVVTSDYILKLDHAGNATVYRKFIGRRQGDELTDIDILHTFRGRAFLFDVDIGTGRKGGGSGISRNWEINRRSHVYRAISQSLDIEESGIYHAVVSWKDRFNPNSPELQKFIELGGVPVGLP